MPSGASDLSVSVQDVLARHPFFQNLPPDAKTLLAQKVIKKSLRRGAVIFSEGDLGIGLVGVLRGSVKIRVTSAGGREVVFNIMNAGDVFGEIALLDGRSRSADAIAMSDCELMNIDRTTFVAVMKSHPDVALRVIEFLCARLRRTSEQVQDSTFLDAPARLAKTLLYLSGESAAGQPRTANVTQQEISQMIGISREMTNKLLRSWTRANLVKLERGSIVILRATQLREIAAEDAG